MPNMESVSAVRGASAPRLPLPAGAWDTHAHVFGPFARYPLASDSRYQPPLAPLPAYRAMLRTAGFAQGVLVHASACGFDNAATLDAVQSAPSALRAVAVVPESTADAEWQRLHAAGVRGLRFTETAEVLGAPKPSGTLGLAALQRLAPRLRELGWHAQIWARCEHLVHAAPWLANCGVPLVIDHMGMFDVARGVGDPVFGSFLRQLAGADYWVKLTAVRVTRQRWCAAEDVRPFHEALLAAIPDRLLFGSDWPFIRLDDDLPLVGALLDQFDRWTADRSLRERILVRNPARLYGAPGDQPA